MSKVKFPKVLIASDGKHTAMMLDGVCFGPGIGGLEYSTHNKRGSARVKIRLLDVDVSRVELGCGQEQFERMLEAMGEE